LREAALRKRPWEHSTGPKTAEGKRRSAANAIRCGLHTRRYDLIDDPLNAAICLCALMLDGSVHGLDIERAYRCACRLVELGDHKGIGAETKADIEAAVSGWAEPVNPNGQR